MFHLIRFGVIAAGATQRDRTRTSDVRELPMRSLAASGDLVETCVEQVANQLSNLSRHVRSLAVGRVLTRQALKPAANPFDNDFDAWVE